MGVENKSGFFYFYFNFYEDSLDSFLYYGLCFKFFYRFHIELVFFIGLDFNIFKLCLPYVSGVCPYDVLGIKPVLGI